MGRAEARDVMSVVRRGSGRSRRKSAEAVVIVVVVVVDNSEAIGTHKIVNDDLGYGRILVFDGNLDRVIALVSDLV